MNAIKAVLFDVDGTLLDTSEFIFQAVEHVTQKHNLEPKERSEIAQYVGHELKDFYKQLHETGDIESLAKAHKEFQYENFHLSKPFPNAQETLKALKEKGIKTATVTSRGKNSALITLKQAGLSPYLDVFVTGDDIVNFKPHPEPVLKALDLLSVNATNALMVGDTVFDIEAGKNAQVKTAWVSYGFGGDQAKALHPDFILNDLSDLLTLI